MAPFDRSHTSSYASSIVTMAVYILYRLWNETILVKNANFSCPIYLTCTIPRTPSNFWPKILIQTVRVPKLFEGAKILPKSSSMRSVQQYHRRQTDRRTADRRTADRQTADRRTADRQTDGQPTDGQLMTTFG